MKVCPICKNNVFDDMDTCFNCLHRFGDENEEEQEETQKVLLPLVEEQDGAYENECAITRPFAICPSEENFLESYYQFLGDYLRKNQRIVP